MVVIGRIACQHAGAHEVRFSFAAARSKSVCVERGSGMKRLVVWAPGKGLKTQYKIRSTSPTRKAMTICSGEPGLIIMITPAMWKSKRQKHLEQAAKTKSRAGVDEFRGRNCTGDEEFPQ